MIYALSVLLIASLLFFYLYYKKRKNYLEIYKKYLGLCNKYEGVIDINKEIENKKDEFKCLIEKLNNLDKEYVEKQAGVESEYQKKKEIYDRLIKEIDLLEDDLEIASYGVYKSHFDFDTSEKYKAKIEEIVDKQKQLIKEKTAIVCHMEWSVGGSKTEGKKMTNQYMKLMLKAFNNECDAAILKVRWNNVSKIEEKIKKAFDSINDLGSVHRANITNNYLNLRLDELRLAYEYQEKLYQEKEEQRQIRERQRDEEKALQEIEKAKKEAEDEGEKYQDALDRAMKEIEKKKGAELEELKQRIQLLQEQVKSAEEKKERALSRAQLVKSGYIYILSNIGSFGENIYKIGMTRRLDPMDRVRELGDASVPFSFDVHAIIYSEDAPALESELHSALTKKRLNLLNQRREFFKSTLEELESIIKEKKLEVELIKIAEAKEYRETLALSKKENVAESLPGKLEDKFPVSL